MTAEACQSYFTALAAGKLGFIIVGFNRYVQGSSIAVHRCKCESAIAVLQVLKLIRLAIQCSTNFKMLKLSICNRSAKGNVDCSVRYNSR
ncbi:hypothetical protein D3C77_647600 [compost metagenome]